MHANLSSSSNISLFYEVMTIAQRLLLADSYMSTRMTYDPGRQFHMTKSGIYPEKRDIFPYSGTHPLR